MGRMTPEDINVIPTYANLINNTIDEGCVAQSQPLWLYFHKLLPGGTQTAPPGVSTEYYVDDFHNLLIYLAAQRDAGVLEIMTTATFYERMVASGVPGGLGFDS